MYNWRAEIRRLAPKPILWKLTPMRLFWASEVHGGRDNFGDELSPLIIKKLFHITVKHSSIATADMIALGSLLGAVEDHVDNLRPYIWGTGFIESGGDYTGRPIRVRAVRGRQSLSRLRHVAPQTVALGDPGILTSIAFPSLVGIEKKYHIGIIPHSFDQDSAEIDKASRLPGVHIIDVHKPALRVIKEISQCKIVFSSSLHGLIVSDSFAVPNFWIRLSDKLEGGTYKFKDYYSTFNVERSPADLAESLSQASNLRRAWKPLDGIHETQVSLIDAFPTLPSFRSAAPFPAACKPQSAALTTSRRPA